jgi:hypothetical protein
LKTVIELYPYSWLLIESDSRPIFPTSHTDLIRETDKPDGTELPVLSLEGTDTMRIEEMARRSPPSRRGVLWTKKHESRGR